MTWTYDADFSDPTDRRDEIRLMVGDTNETVPMVQDEEIEYVLSQFPPADDDTPPWLAAAHVCDTIAAQFARKMQQALGPLSASNQQQYEHYLAEAQKYRVLYATEGKGIIEGDRWLRVKRAVPVLGGGGRTVLGGGEFSNPTDVGDI